MIIRKLLTLLFLSFIIHSAKAEEIPSKYIELLDYVQQAPDQGESNSCLYVASTGAMELIANKVNGIKHPKPYGPYDLAESFLMHQSTYTSRGKYFWEIPVLKFNYGYGINVKDWPFEAWNDTYESSSPWNYRNWSDMEKVKLPKVNTIPLFVLGNKWSTYVLNKSHIKQIKEALWKYKSPILVNYNDDYYWHVVLIVGYDDKIPGDCYDNTPAHECSSSEGAFYVRDSFGITVEVRDYDWFRIKGNAAFVVKEVK